MLGDFTVSDRLSKLARHIYATHVNVPDYMMRGGAAYRIVTDHRGSPRLVVNAATGSVAQRLDYDEFGNIAVDTNPGFQPFGFAGGIYDRDTGLTHFGRREYDSQTGRWTSKDPLHFNAGSTLLFGYCGNDPINNVDPAGLDYLTFNGKSLTWNFTEGSPIGPSGQHISWPANSGGSDGSDPIPSGGYWVSPNDVRPRSDTDAWGNYSFRLRPDRKNRTKRSGFYIHAGRFKGTHGCIEMSGPSSFSHGNWEEEEYDKERTQLELDQFRDILQKYGKRIHLQVME